MAAVRTAIELTEHEARVLQVRVVKDRPQVKTAVRIALPAPGELDPQNLRKARAEALREGLRAAGLKFSSTVIVIPKRSATVRYVVLPSTDDAELGRMARFEAERHIPFNAQRHVISHCVMRKDGINGSSVLLAAVDSPELEELKEMAAAAGFDIESVNVSSLAQFNIVSAFAPATGGDKTIGYLHVGLSSSDITIASHGLLLFTRSVPYGLERLMAELRENAPAGCNFSIEDLRKVDLLNPTEGLKRLGLIPDSEIDETVLELGHEPMKATVTHGADDCLREWLNRLSVEIQRSYEFARRELDCPPITSIVVAGEAAAWPNFSTYIQAGFSVETTSLPSLNGLADPQSVMSDPQLFVGTAGALMRFWKPSAFWVNLMPMDYRPKGALRRRRQSILVSAGLVLACLVMAFILLKQLQALRDTKIAGLKALNERLSPLASSLLDRESQLKIINSYRYDKRSALAVLETISKKDYLPRHISITVFDYSREHLVRISGWALTIADLGQFEMDLSNATDNGEKVFPGGVVRKASEMQQHLEGRDQELIKYQVEAYFK